jgi:chromosome segregation ATPase
VRSLEERLSDHETASEEQSARLDSVSCELEETRELLKESEEQRTESESRINELTESLSLSQNQVSELESMNESLSAELSRVREDLTEQLRGVEEAADEEKSIYEHELSRLRQIVSSHQDSHLPQEPQVAASPDDHLLEQIRESSTLLGEMVHILTPSLVESENVDFQIPSDSNSETHLSFLQRSLLVLRLSVERSSKSIQHLEQQVMDCNETMEYQQKKIDSLKTNKKNLLEELHELQETVETLQEMSEKGSRTKGGRGHGEGGDDDEEEEDSSTARLRFHLKEQQMSIEIENLKKQLSEVNGANGKYVTELEQMIENLQHENFDLKSLSTGLGPSSGSLATNGYHAPHSASPSPPIPSSSHGLTPDLEDLMDNMTMKIKKLETQLNASKKHESQQVLLNSQLENEKNQLLVRCEELEDGMRSLVEASEGQEFRIQELLREIQQREEEIRDGNSVASTQQLKALEGTHYSPPSVPPSTSFPLLLSIQRSAVSSMKSSRGLNSFLRSERGAFNS